MEQWIERWQEGRTGWHEAEGNASLKRHWRAKGRRVLVPMCGKSYDLVWLADQGNEVIGVELSDIAVSAFFAESGLRFEITDDEMPTYRAVDKPITIYCGDFFALTSIRCDAHYDRGALIALSQDLRGPYAMHTRSLLEPGAEQLLVSLEYDQSVADGPPFSVDAEEVLSYWPDLVRLGAYDDIENAPPKFIESGLTEMLEVTWRSP